MSIKRWYDLKDQGAKLDRLTEDSGSGYLSLSFGGPGDLAARVNEETVHAVQGAGWVVPDPDVAELRNYGNFRDLSEIGRALSPVFGDDEVQEALVSRDKLRQGEVLEGVDRPIYVDKEHIDQSMRHLPDMLRQRAMQLIEQAREQQQRFKGASIGTTGGRIWEVSEAVAHSTEIGLGTAVAKVSAVRFDQEFFDKIAGLASSSRDADRDALTRELGTVQINDEAVRAARRKGLTLGHTGEELERFAATQYLLTRGGVGDMVLDLDHPQAESAPISQGFERQVHGYKFEVSADTTTLAAREYQARIGKAMEYMADVFGMEPDDLFNPNTRIRVVQGFTAGNLNGVAITAKTRGHDQFGEAYSEEDGAVVFHQGTMGTALHEMCHALDRRLGDQSEKYEVILGRSGLQERFEAVVSEAALRGDPSANSPEHAKYLTSEPEVFARLLESALKDHCLRETGSLDALGGHAVAGFHENYAPTNPETMDQVLRVVRSWGEEHGVMNEDLGGAPTEAAEVENRAGRSSSPGMAR